MNLFDGIQTHIQDVVFNTFGKIAVWIPSNSEPERTAKVGFKNPSEVAGLLGINYGPETPFIEFKPSSFEGLKYLTDEGSREEYIRIEGLEYSVIRVIAIEDGAGYLAELSAGKPVS